MLRAEDEDPRATRQAQPHDQLHLPIQSEPRPCQPQLSSPSAVLQQLPAASSERLSCSTSTRQLSTAATTESKLPATTSRLREYDSTPVIDRVRDSRANDIAQATALLEIRLRREGKHQNRQRVSSPGRQLDIAKKTQQRVRAGSRASLPNEDHRETRAGQQSGADSDYLR